MSEKLRIQLNLQHAQDELSMLTKEIQASRKDPSVKPETIEQMVRKQKRLRRTLGL